MEKMIDKGIVCFCDILGYKNILKNNNVNNCAKLIKEIIIKLPSNVKNDLLATIPQNHSLTEKVNNFFEKHYNYIIISDTIIFFFDYEKLDDEQKDLAVMISVFFIIRFQWESYKIGFPMRSCIDFGQFFYFNNVFAGETIVECNKECELLNFSGIVITERAAEFVINNINEISRNLLALILTIYIVPLNNGDEKEKCILDWYTNSHDSNFSNDLKQEIFNSFHMHNKTVNKSVMEKISNTEKTIRYFIYRRMNQQKLL